MSDVTFKHKSKKTFIVLCTLIAGFLFQNACSRPDDKFIPEQKIDFSHKIHAGENGIACNFCHPYTDRSKYAGIPSVAKCMYCHNYLVVETDEIRKIHTCFENKLPIVWDKKSEINDYVFFTHKPHIKNDVACQKCHGEVIGQDRIMRKDYKMRFCVSCHREREVNLDCLTCHN